MRASKPVTALPADPQDRENVADVILCRLVQEALDDPRPPIPAEEVFARLRAHHQARLRTAEREA